jgi:hypothetical protein
MQNNDVYIEQLHLPGPHLYDQTRRVHIHATDFTSYSQLEVLNYNVIMSTTATSN